MAKDPAFLFYPGDWLGGTMTLNRLQKGCYIDILIAQFNDGPLSLEKIRTVLGQDQANWTVLSSKFKQDSNGLFYNERLAAEVEKRNGFIMSRSVNGRKKGKKKALDKAYAFHMDKLPENINRNGIKNGFQKGGVGENEIFAIEDCLKIALRDPRWVRANKTDHNEIENFNHYLERQALYSMNPADYKKYFAKLKGRYPETLKRELSTEDLRRIAAEMDAL